jgi:DNA-binding transcriptional regulator YiaG
VSASSDDSKRLIPVASKNALASFRALETRMSLAYAEEAIHVHDTGHLSDRDIARATGAAPSTVREWLARRSAPSGVRAERLAELSSLVERLARVIRPTYIPVWLSKPIPALDDDKPIDRIAKGDYRAVARLISGLEDPGAS